MEQRPRREGGRTNAATTPLPCHVNGDRTEMSLPCQARAIVISVMLLHLASIS
jgi:hypothetical protein